MKELNFNSFIEWIKREFPDIHIVEGGDENSASLSYQGMDGPIVFQEGLEASYFEMPEGLEYNIMTLEEALFDLKSTQQEGEVDIEPEISDLENIIKRIKEKSEKGGEFLYKTSLNGLLCRIIPFRADKVDKLQELVVNYYIDAATEYEENFNPICTSLKDFLNE